MDINKINAYIRMVADDAYKSERRTGVFKYQICALDDVVMLDFRTEHERVGRRIAYRLAKNFERNCGCKLAIGNRYGDQVREQTDTRLKFFLSDSSVSPNHTIAYCKLLGKWRSVNCCYKTEETALYLNPDYDNDAPHSVLYARMKELVDNPSGFTGETGWNEYCKLYERLYGFSPRAQEKLRVYPEQEFVINIVYAW